MDRKPSITLFYNKTKDGVDTLDRMVRSYSTKHMTRRWPLVLFYYMIDVSTINAFITWQGINHENGNMRMSQRRKFLISFGKNCTELQKKYILLHQFLQPEMGMLLLLEMVLH